VYRFAAGPLPPSLLNHSGETMAVPCSGYGYMHRIVFNILKNINNEKYSKESAQVCILQVHCNAYRGGILRR
jgi:hypothetical protein